MKLYELPNGSSFTLAGETFQLDHLDGMYSYCIDNKGNVCHFAVWTEVDKCDPE